MTGPPVQGQQPALPPYILPVPPVQPPPTIPPPAPAAPTEPTFTPPESIDFNARGGVGSDLDKQEWVLRNQRINELLSNIRQRQDLAQHLADTGHTAPAALADQLANRAATPPVDPQVDYVERNRLLGAAQYYGIQGADKIPLDALQKIVDAKRLGVHRPEKWMIDDKGFMPTVGAAGEVLGVGMTNAFLGTVESLAGLAKHVPFIADHLNDRKDWDAMSQRLASFTEGLNNEMSRPQAARAGLPGTGSRPSDDPSMPSYSPTIAGVGDAVGAGIIAWPLWEVAGAVGGGPGLALYGARMSAIERAVIQGTTVAGLMRGGRPDGGPPDQFGMTPKDKEIAMGGAFAGIVTGIAPALGYLAGKVKASFPVKSAPGDAAPWSDPATVDADWHFVDEGGPSTQKLLPPGPPLLDASGAQSHLPPGIAENAPLDVQRQIAASQPPPPEPVEQPRDLTKIVPQGAPGVGLEPHAPDATMIKVVSRDATGKPIGILTLQKTGPNSADAFTVYVDPAMRRQGVATQLYDAAEKAGLRVRSGQSGLSADGKAFTDARLAARGDAVNYSKQATIMESPASMDMSRQPQFDDADVARAAIQSLPSSAHVIQGVGDPASVMRKFAEGGIAPREVRLVQKGFTGDIGSYLRNDLMVSNGKPLTDAMVQEYQQHGMFTGQQVTHAASGIEGQLVDINPVRATIRSGSSDFIVPTADVLPGRSSVPAHPTEVGIPDAPVLYSQFKDQVMRGFTQEASAAGIGFKDWLSPEVASVLPRRMTDFFVENGVTDPAQQHALDTYFNQERVVDYQMSQPKAFADMHAALSDVMDAWNSGPIDPGDPTGDSGVYQLADTKNFVWQHHPGMPSGTLRDLHSGDTFPMDHEGAALEFLKNINRELPDHTPISDVPMEIGEAPVGAANPGRTTEGGHDTQDMIDAFPDHEEGLEEELNMVNAEDASAQIPTHPGVVNEPLLSLPPRVTLGPRGGSPPIPPDQPPPPSSTSGWGEGESPRLPGAQPETLGSQFARAQRVQPKNLEEVGNRYDSIIMRFLNPMRSLTMRMTPWLDKMGIDARNLWADGQALYEGRIRSHNEAHPWMTEARESIYNQLPRKMVRDGTVTKLAEIADFNQRMSEMTRLGMNDDQISAVNRLEAFNNRFFEQEMVGEMGHNSHQRIFGYMSHVRARQADPNFKGDPYTDDGGHLGAFDWYADHARTGGLDFREMNAERLTDHMIRAAMFEKHLAPTWNDMRTAWSDPRIPEKFASPILDWLDVVRGGYNPKYQVAIQGVRQVLNTVGIPATDRDVQGMWNFVFKNTYRAGLGFKPAAFFRDSIQPMFAWTRFGNMPEFAGVYRDVLTDPAARQDMLDRGYNGGWIEKGRVRAAVSEAFDPVRSPEGVDLANNQFRENVNKVVDFIHDRMPDRFKGGIQGTYADPMYVYGQKLGTFNRLVAGETGWRVASKALDLYSAGDITLPQLMDQSGAQRSMPAIRDQFQALATQGRNQEAANIMAHEWADTQFRGGITENPMGIRSLAGRAASMYGNFTVGYINQMKEGLSAGTVGDRVKFAMRQAAILLAIGEAEKRTKWKGLSNWQWYAALGFAGGPLAMGALAASQVVSGGIGRIMGQQPSPQQSDALRADFGPTSPNANPNTSFPASINPYRGAIETAEGLYGAATSATPADDAARFLLTNDRRGQGGGPSFDRWYQSLPLQAANRPQLDPAFGRPMPSASLVAPDTAPGAPPTAPNLPDPAQPNSGPLQGENYDQYRRRVLAKTTWSPDTTAIQNMNRLRPEVREPLKAMMADAAKAGVQLQVGESGRTQERQEMLFQQGRSRPGPQVTWTLNSDHAAGRAADLVSPTPGGYLWIQQNAAKYGFHTLGPTDPGHVYMPAMDTTSGGIKSFIDTLLRVPPSSGGGAHQ